MIISKICSTQPSRAPTQTPRPNREIASARPSTIHFCLARVEGTPALSVPRSRPDPAELLQRLSDLLLHRLTAVADFLREGATSTNLDLVRRGFEISDRLLNPLQDLTDCLLEDQAIQRYNRHHRIIRVHPNPVLDGHLGRQSLQIDCGPWPSISERHPVELLEEIALHDLEALFRHDREFCCVDRLVERQLGGDHFFDVATKGVLISL